MDDYWDSEAQWADEARCPTCGNRIYEDVSACSATCSDIQALMGRLRGALMDGEDEYADR